ncbi:FtsX-like permease family protein [Chryseolinea serpens]|uniref:FtsX-like permease family protein n=1 Tax=Chryseolinea serpens TaxID=947013 RepID=A0A1M5WVH1_9BACT|nr:ABC transporter permease [Chryseolinea serpens]SHH91392.1 FtsX-like permease family protein [Chryseolinea serpens]
MKRGDIRPPRWATRLLHWYCRAEIVEDLEGDLNEYFQRHARSKGIGRARLIYVIDVFKFFRSYTVRKPNFVDLLIQWIMIGSYIKTSGRSIVRHKLFSAINIAGLAVSMSVGLVVIVFISDLMSYDSFHEKRDRIYRVITTNGSMVCASTSVVAGKKIDETLSGIEALTLLRRGFGGDVTAGPATLPISGLWADASFFKVFTFPLLYGDPATVLKEPYSLVLTEQSAKKIFGVTDVLGRSVKVDTLNYVITGVMKDIPKLSHLRFESLASFSTVELQKPDTDGGFMSWGSLYMNYVYLVLQKDSDPSVLQTSLDKISAAENRGLVDSKISLSLQPLADIAIGKKLVNQIGPVMNSAAIWILAGLAAVVILSACFNYTNLSVARAFRRSREVGIRKIIGAGKGHVMGQFLMESVIISLMALVVSFLLFLFLRTQFISLHSFLENLAVLKLTPGIVLSFIAFAIAVGIAAGIIPALLFSRINPNKVLKDASTLKLFRHVNLRKGLIVVQYFFSLIFITSTLVGYKQYSSFLAFDLGFTTENILNINLQGNSANAVIKELKELPEVEGASQSLIVMSLGHIYGLPMKYEKTNDSAGVWLNIIDEHYLPLHRHTLLAGKNFTPKQEGATESETIVNERLLKRFNIANSDPAKAIGEEVTIDGKKLTIVGVVKDFHYETVEDNIEPMAFRYFANTNYGFVNVKINSHDLPATRARIEEAWRKVDKVHPLDAKFYDDQIEQAYSAFSMMLKVIGFLAFLAVCISSMGLFGMVVFTTETRLKEISIRKVLGASEGKLIVLLSKGFILLLSIAAGIALPITYLFFDKVVLANFVYHDPIGWPEMLIGFLSVMAIAFLMVGSQTFKVARSNPAEVLKRE